MRTVPGKEVDSLIIRVELFRFSPILLQADSIKVRSGFLSLVSGVGTAITGVVLRQTQVDIIQELLQQQQIIIL